MGFTIKTFLINVLRGLGGLNKCTIKSGQTRKDFINNVIHLCVYTTYTTISPSTQCIFPVDVFQKV